MALEKDIYAAFAGVVGEENLCDDPVMMAAYFKTDFAAVIMPKDTAEVQAVVRLCNKYKLKFRPICTGWTGFVPPGHRPARPAADGPDHRDQREEHVRGGRAVRDLRPAAGRAVQAGPQHQHQGRRLAVLGHAARPRAPGPVDAGPTTATIWRSNGSPPTASWSSSAPGIGGRVVLRRRAGPVPAVAHLQRGAAQLHAGRVHQGGA